MQTFVVWLLWTLFDGRRIYTERKVNEVLKAANGFGDHVTLRRELINHQLVTRTSDCAAYRKLKPQPDAGVQALLQAWRQVCRSRNTPQVERDDSPRQRQAAAAAVAAAGAG